MPKENWGTKRVCPETGKRFYDLGRDPIVSPYTGTEYQLSDFTGERPQTSMADKEDTSRLSDVTSAELTDSVDTLDDSDAGSEIDEDIPDIDDEDDTVDIEEIADVPSSDDDNN